MPVWQGKMKNYGGIAFIPTTFIIDQEMNIVQKHFGFQSFETLESEVRKLLGQ